MNERYFANIDPSFISDKVKTQKLDNEFEPSPTIEVDESLKYAPYFVTIDRKSCGEFLRQFGVPDEDIKSQRIILTRRRKQGRKNLFADVGAIFNLKDKTLRFYTDTFWKIYQNYFQLANKLAQNRSKPNKYQFGEILFTKKLSGYLTTAPAERGIRFADRLFLKGIQRRLNSTFYHEVKHILDSRNKLLMASRNVLPTVLLGYFTWGITASLEKFGVTPTDIPPIDLAANALIGFLISHHIILPVLWHTTLLENFDLIELRAVSFAKNIKNPKWQSILRLTKRN